MKVLVTGANGYLGKGVTKEFLNRGVEIVAASNHDNNIDKRARILCGDIFSVDDPYEYYDRPDVILHMAWRDGFVHSSQNHIDDLPKHYHFLKRFIESDAKQITVLGSMHEVGFFEGSVNEHTPCNPQSLYGISKNALREIVTLECKNNRKILQWLRGFYIVGNTIDGSSIFSKIVQAANAGKREFPFTEGLNQFDFIDYDDFCSLVADVVLQSEINGVINICSGRPEKLANRVERFIKENNFDIKLQYGAFPDRPYDSKAIWGDDFKIRMIEKVKEQGA